MAAYLSQSQSQCHYNGLQNSADSLAQSSFFSSDFVSFCTCPHSLNCRHTSLLTAPHICQTYTYHRDFAPSSWQHFPGICTADFMFFTFFSSLLKYYLLYQAFSGPLFKILFLPKHLKYIVIVVIFTSYLSINFFLIFLQS